MYGTFRAPRATFVSFAVLGVLTAACGKKADTTAAAPITVNIGKENVAIIGTATLTSGPSISGTLVAEKTASIRAEVAGPVTAVLIEPGVRVQKGTPLARIDDTVLRDSYLSMRSAVTQAQLAADIAVREQSRSEKLLAAGAIADNALEVARRNNLAAQAQLEDAKARMAGAQKNLDNTTIRAPYSGIVSERQVNAGDVVSIGAAMFTVVDPTSMRLEGAVPADQLGSVHLGAKVSFAVTGYPGKTFEGTISNIYPSADPQTRQVRLYARIPNTGSGLVAGLYATGRVSSVTHQGLAAPLNAVDQRGLKPSVVRIKNGKTERVEVTLGLREDATERVEILTGVAAGDTVLVGAAQGITPGTPIKVSAPSDKPTTVKP